MRLLALSLIAALIAVAGCGGGEETTSSDRAAPTEAFGHKVDRIRTEWEGSKSCERPPGASRWGCSVGAYRCQGVVSGRGWSVSCAKPGESIAFRVRPG